MRREHVPLGALLPACFAAIALEAVHGTQSPARAGAPSDSLNLGAPRRAIVEVGLPPRTPSPLDSVPHPWPGVALTLSAVGTAAPLVVMGVASKSHSDAGIALGILATEIVTPSAGHLYAGLMRRAGIGIAVRAVGYGVLAAGAAAQGLWPGQSETSDFTYGVLAMALGATIMAGSAVVDVVSAPMDVDKKNAEWLRQHASVGLRVAPDAIPELCLSLRF
jgi:hypothetical protein